MFWFNSLDRSIVLLAYCFNGLGDLSLDGLKDLMGVSDTVFDAWLREKFMFLERNDDEVVSTFV